MSSDSFSFAFAGFRSPNYTPVPDELFDQLMPQLSDSELRVLLYIVRRTFGFKRQSDNISLTQMVEGITTREGVELDRGTGLSKSPVVRALRGLKAKGVIVTQRNASAERGFEATTYRLHVYGESLTPSAARGTSPLGPPETQALDRRRHRQETEEQETEKTSKSRKRHSQQLIANEETDPAEQGSQTSSHQAQPYPTRSTAGGATESTARVPESLQDALEPPTQANTKEPPRTPVLEDPAAELGHSPDAGSDLPAGEGFARFRDRANKLRAELRQEHEAARAGEKTTGRRRRREATGSPEEREHLGAYLGPWLPQFNDQAPSSSITRAYNLFRRANVDASCWGDYLHQAKAILREHQAQVQKPAEKQDNKLLSKNLTPYYFAILADLLGLKSEETTSVGASDYRP